MAEPPNEDEPNAENLTPERKRGRPRQDQKRDLQHALLTSAIDLFAHGGFDGVSLKQIAAQCRADIGLIRYYFGTKAELWETAMTHLANVYVEELLAANTYTGGSKTDALKALIRANLIAASKWPQVSRIIVFDGNKSDARGAFIQSRFVAPFHFLISDFIEGAKEEGRVPNVSTRTIFFMIAHGGAFPMALPALANSIPGEDIGSEQGLEAHIDAILALLIRD
ncbi:MAG: TetR/AcrR family transcriptional regulator [Pseudomonadota bacterium]